MIHQLLKVAAGIILRPAPVPATPRAFLRKVVTCHRHKVPARLVRFIGTHPAGMRGYYRCAAPDCVLAIDRRDVTQVHSQGPDRINLM